MIYNYICTILFALVPLVWSKQINGNYFNAKLFSVYFLSGLCLLLTSVILKKRPQLKLKKSLLGCCLFLASYMILQPLFSENAFSILYIFKPLTFCVFAYYFYVTDIDTDERSTLFNLFNWAMTGIVLTLTAAQLYEIYQIRFIQDSLEQGRILGTFGNVNMLSEFFILALPLVYFWSNDKSTISAHLKTLTLALWIFIILYTRSRSTWIGLGLFAAYMVYNNLNKKILMRDLIVFSVSLIMYFICVLLPASGGEIVDHVKKNSFAERLSLYKASVELISDRPLGIGLGNFTNEIIPYRLKQDFKPYEYEFADQPHSEVLKWGLQYGVFGLLICIIFLFLIFLNLLKTKNIFLLSAFLVIIPQIAFQFPFENPASLLVIALYFGYWLKTQKGSDTDLTFKVRSVFAVLSLILLVNSLLFISAIVVESQFKDDLEKSALLCKLYPINQRNCNHKNVLLLQNNQTAQFRSELKTEINYSYLTSDLQRILPMYFLKMNDEKRLCENALIYELMYPAQRHFESKDLTYCRKYPVPLKFENPMQFRADYRLWLEKSVF